MFLGGKRRRFGEVPTFEKYGGGWREECYFKLEGELECIEGVEGKERPDIYSNIFSTLHKYNEN